MSIPVTLSTTLNSDLDIQGLISLYTGSVGLCQKCDSPALMEIRDQLAETLKNQFPQNWDEMNAEVQKLAAKSVELAGNYDDFTLED